MKCREVQIDQQKMLLVTTQSSVYSFLGLIAASSKIKIKPATPNTFNKGFLVSSPSN